FATTAPVESVTVPLTAPASTCAIAETENSHVANRATTTTLRGANRVFRDIVPLRHRAMCTYTISAFVLSLSSKKCIRPEKNDLAPCGNSAPKCRRINSRSDQPAKNLCPLSYPPLTLDSVWRGIEGRIARAEL